MSVFYEVDRILIIKFDYKGRKLQFNIIYDFKMSILNIILENINF